MIKSRVSRDADVQVFISWLTEVAALPEFQSAKWVKVNPDSPQAEASNGHWFHFLANRIGVVSKSVFYLLSSLCLHEFWWVQILRSARRCFDLGRCCWYRSQGNCPTETRRSVVCNTICYRTVLLCSSQVFGQNSSNKGLAKANSDAHVHDPWKAPDRFFQPFGSAKDPSGEISFLGPWLSIFFSAVRNNWCCYVSQCFDKCFIGNCCKFQATKM